MIVAATGDGFTVVCDGVGAHRREARALGALFGPVALAGIVTSPLLRAAETAAAIAGTTRVGVEVDGDLIDRDYGRWAGRSVGGVMAEFGSLESIPDIEAARRGGAGDRAGR